MNNRSTISLALLSVLLLSMYVSVMTIPSVSAVYDPHHLIYDTMGEPETSDPAWCYDTASAELIYNVYDPLVFFDVDYTEGLYDAGKVDKFRHVLATQGILEDINEVDPDTGVTYLQKYTWKIRGVDQRQKYMTPSMPLPPDWWLNPKSTWWTEQSPQLSILWHLCSWYDIGVGGEPFVDLNGNGQYNDGVNGPAEPFTDTNLNGKRDGDGILNVKDKIDMNTEMYPQPWAAPWITRLYFDVEEVTLTPPSIKVREQPVPFHNGAILTAEDVEYSFERAMVQDRSGGPTWMLWEPLLQTFYAESPASDPLFGLKIDRAVEDVDLDGDLVKESVVMKLASAFPMLPFMQILSQSWSSIVNKAWCQAKGDLNVESIPGGWSDWAAIWDAWHDPAASFIEADMMGTGPYYFHYWDPGVSWEVYRFLDYWNRWPAPIFPYCDLRKPNYLDVLTWYYLPSWTTRYFRFVGCESDVTDVPRMYRDEVLGYPGIRCYYPFDVMSLSAYFYTFNVTDTSPYLGVPGGLPLGTFDQTGIPPDIFLDINVRKGIAYNFDYDSWLLAAYLGEGWKPPGPIPSTISYYNPAQETYTYDPVKAEYYLKLAWGGNDDDGNGIVDPGDEGALWTNGMKFTVTFNIGNVPRETAAAMIRDQMNAINPKFHLDTLGVAWGPVYLPQMVAGELPLFIIGWLADYPDPHNFVYPFQHTYGTFSAWQKYSNPTVDALIKQGIETPDGPARQAIYHSLQDWYFEDVPGVALVEAKGRRYEKEYMRNYYYNPVHPHDGSYWYERWKAKDINSYMGFGDANADMAVDIYDAALVSYHWYPGPPMGPGGHSPNPDMTGGTGGTSGSLSGPIAGIPDGRVDIADAAFVSAYWGT